MGEVWNILYIYISCQELVYYFCPAGDIYIFINFLHFQQLTVANFHYDKLKFSPTDKIRTKSTIFKSNQIKSLYFRLTFAILAQWTALIIQKQYFVNINKTATKLL